jgi:hypothetical protein
VKAARVFFQGAKIEIIRETQHFSIKIAKFSVHIVRCGTFEIQKVGRALRKISAECVPSPSSLLQLDSP